MTWFGKTLVLLNLALSGMLLGWSVALFLTRTDWSNQQGKDGRPDGELRVRQDQVKQLWELLPPSEYVFKRSRDELKALEEGSEIDPATKEALDGRIANWAWYDSEFQYIRTGDENDKPKRASKDRPAGQCRILDKDEKGEITLKLLPDPANYGRPKLVPATDRTGKPLRSFAAYDRDEKKFYVDLARELKRLAEASRKDIDLTDLLLGPKGLQARIKAEGIRYDEIMSEHDLVKRPLINTNVEAELLLKRKRELEYRVAELEKAWAAQRASLGLRP